MYSVSLSCENCVKNCTLYYEFILFLIYLLFFYFSPNESEDERERERERERDSGEGPASPPTLLTAPPLPPPATVTTTTSHHHHQVSITDSRSLIIINWTASGTGNLVRYENKRSDTNFFLLFYVT